MGTKSDDLPIEFLECMGKLVIRPDDTVVFRLNGAVTKQRERLIREGATFIQKTYRANCLFLDEATDIGVISKDG